MTDSGVGFLSLSHRLPGRAVASAELEDKLALGRGVIERLTGVRSRRYLGPGESITLLAAEACREAIEAAGDPALIDGLIYYSDTPPVLVEGGGHRKIYYDISAHIQNLLAQSGVPLVCDCVGIAGSCVSFLLSLQMAIGLIRTGMKRRILLVGAACNSIFLENVDKNTAMTFGDGTAAAVLGETDGAVLQGIFCRTDGRGFDAGGFLDYQSLFIDRKRVAEFAPLGFEAGLRGLMERTGLSLDDIDLIIPHQAGIKIIERGMALAGVPPEKVYLCLRDVGNTGAPAVQLALARAFEEGRIRDGALVALAAFGTGWNYGAAVFRYRRPADAGRAAAKGM
jgi:3-oxoacyl-[acyl-carrier-protein] synthase III